MNETFTFVDLFSGIGGFHIGCVRNGGICKGACEINQEARQIYQDNYQIKPHDDIKTLAPIRNIDLVCAGFPCQSHSTLGLRLGLKDKRGKLFEDLKRFLAASQPRAFLLENVKGLLSSNSGRSFDRVRKSLEEIGYHVSWAVLDTQNFGLPQHRERIYIVGSKEKTFDFDKLKRYAKHKKLYEILDKGEPNSELRCDIFDKAEIFKKPVETDTGFILRAKLSNFTNRKLFSSNGIIGTIATASPPPIYDERYKMTRHLSKNELKRCQGFPTSFKFSKEMSRSDVVKYIGNAVSVNVIQAIVHEMKKQGVI